MTKLRQKWQISHSGVIRTHATGFRCRHKKQLSSEDDWWRNVALFFAQSMDRFHMTSRRPLVHETMKRLPCWCIEKLL